MENTLNLTDVINPFESDKYYADSFDKLLSLRVDGENKIIALSNENRDLKTNKQISKAQKEELINKNKEEITSAKEVKNQNKEEVKNLVKEVITKANSDGKTYYAQVKELVVKANEEAKLKYQEELQNERVQYESRLSEVEAICKENLEKASGDQEALKNAKKQNAIIKKSEAIAHNSKIREIKSNYENIKQNNKTELYNAYLEKHHTINKASNNKLVLNDYFENYFKTYAYNFKFGPWLLKNALYIIVILFFIVSFIAGLAQGKNLLTGHHILAILGQSSVKVFFALGVAGLILLGGTDLSVGRITGLGASFASLALADTVYSGVGGFSLNFTGAPTAVKVLLAFLLPIFLCTFFSSIAGFFTAKFKMHPFITTLSTQLVIYGLFKTLYPSTSAFNMNSTIRNQLRGNNYLNIIIAAAIVIFIVWFIWNKTKFGKNMYAVGGNAEAASVSGISVFWVTLGVFIMAGILYGFGGVATALQGAGSNFDTGVGTELDAIAACVIGGVSFSGGIGKISGVIVGTIIFTGLTYCLTFLGLDANAQYIFKGVIIMAAVCLDSIKYLKKK